MVLIEAPTTEGNAPSRPPARPAIAPSVTEKPTGPSKRPNEFADTVEDLTHYGTVEADELRSVEDAAATVDSHDAGLDSTAAADERAAELPLDDDWTSLAARHRRRMVLTGLFALGGVVLAVMLFVWLTGEEAVPLVVVPSPQRPMPDSPAQPPASSAAVPVEPSKIAPTPPSPGPTPEEVEPAPAVEPPKTPDPNAAKKKSPAVSTTPPDLVPKNDDQIKADKISGSGSLAETLRKLSGLVDGDEAKSDVPPDAAPPPEPIADSPTKPEPPFEPARLPRPAARDVDVAARLADPIAEVEFKGTPLVDFLTFITNYSTIPVSLDPDPLVWLNATPTSPVTLHLTETTVGKVLDEALPKLGLTAVTADNQLFVTRRLADAGAKRPAKRNLADLVGADAARGTELVQLLTTLVVPESWQEAGGTGTIKLEADTLVIEQTDDVVLALSVFCERLRVARGLPPQNKRFDAKLFAATSRSARGAEALGKPVSLTFARPTSFPRIVRRIAQETGVAIVIDWRAAATVGWNPDAEVTFSVADKPLGEALTSLLQPMELTYRVVDATTVQVSTPEAIDAQPEIEFYPVGDLLGEANDAEGLLKRVAATLPADWFVASGGNGVVRIDPISRHLIAAMPQPRQVELEKTLAKWRMKRL